MTTDTHTAAGTKRIRLARRSPYHWQVTLDHPPLNIFGPDTIPQLDEVVTALETDEHVKVVVFDSAVEGFFMTHAAGCAKADQDVAGTGISPAG